MEGRRKIPEFPSWILSGLLNFFRFYDFPFLQSYRKHNLDEPLILHKCTSGSSCWCKGSLALWALPSFCHLCSQWHWYLNYSMFSIHIKKWSWFYHSSGRCCAIFACWCFVMLTGRAIWLWGLGSAFLWLNLNHINVNEFENFICILQFSKWISGCRSEKTIKCYFEGFLFQLSDWAFRSD